MGSSAKKKREKKQDFQKTKLKVGKARPKNTNATDTSFVAKSIVLKQQNLAESDRDALVVFDHNLSLLSSRNDTQRRDALSYLVGAILATTSASPPRPTSTILTKCQALILDGSPSVRQHLLKLFKTLPPHQLGTIDGILLYVRAGMTHLSADIRSTSLDALDWLVETNGKAVVSCAGGWVKSLATFQNLLSWDEGPSNGQAGEDNKWSTTKTSNTSTAGTKLLVHQLSTLAVLLSVGLQKPSLDVEAEARKTAKLFPLWQTQTHLLPSKSNVYGHLNLFGAPRMADSEVYDDAEERRGIFHELGFFAAFSGGVQHAKSIGGEVGRAAARVHKALRLAEGD